MSSYTGGAGISSISGTVDVTGSVALDSIVSANNSTTTPLDAFGEYTGIGEEQFKYALVTTTFAAEPAAASGTLFLEISQDNVNWDASIQLPVSDPTSGAESPPHSLIPTAKYFRTRYVNGAVSQSAMRHQTILHAAKSKGLTSRLNQSLNDTVDVENVRAVIAGRFASGKYTNANMDAMGDLKVAIESPKSAFGEITISEITPVIQEDAIYNSLQDWDQFTTGSGAISSSNGQYAVMTGTTVGSFAVLQSLKAVRYRPGQATIFRFTARFTSGTLNSQQRAGPTNASSALQFGYSGSTFSALRSNEANLHMEELTISTGASGAETITINLDGVGHDVGVSSGSTAETSAQIVVSGSFPGYEAWQNDSKVLFVRLLTALQTGSFTMSSTGGAVGAFTNVQSGSVPAYSWINQSDWNIDVMDGTNSTSNPSGMLLDPTKGNVYQVEFQYLGYGKIQFSIEDEESGDFTPVHTIRYANNNIAPSLTDPTMRMGWSAVSLGSTTDLHVHGASCLGGTHGKIVRHGSARAKSNTKNVNSALTNIISFRVRPEFRGKVNLIEVIPVTAFIAPEGNKAVTAQILINPTIVGTQEWAYFDEDNSVVEYELSGSAVTGGSQIATLVVGGGGQTSFDFEKLNLTFVRGDVITIAASVSPAADVAGSLNWLED